MFVNAHAGNRLRERLPAAEAAAIIARLEATPGEPGIVGIIVARLRGETRGDQRSEVELRASNGDTVVAIVADGEVTTVYYRRSWNQRLDAAGLGVGRVVRWT
ncbi:MAG TPA: hypothetical protein VFI40_04800 [Nocardioides sp.]|nr:hypothetical protein [Nocardioides sp.]